jgi:hypothetical protein
LNNSLKPDLVVSQDLSSGALSYTTTFTRKFRINQIIFHASVAITETITITFISAKGSSYNSVLRVINLSSSQDARYIPDSNNEIYQDGDAIKIECTNAHATGVIYASIKAQEILK